MFKKVSFEQYKKDCIATGISVTTQEEEDALREEWEKIKLPVRATPGSAGYDFFLPRTLHLTPDHNVFFPTGIRCVMDDICVNAYLALVPKSGLGCKYGVRLLNTMGVVDKDYAHSDNEGHIMCGMTVSRSVKLKAGDKYMQGILQMFFTFHDEEPPMEERNGGFGSTGR